MKDTIETVNRNVDSSRTHEGANDTFTGAKHPLALEKNDSPVQAVVSKLASVDLPNAPKLEQSQKPAAKIDFKGAVEVINNTGDKKEVQKPLSGALEAGDHTIKMQDGREFQVHVPVNDGTQALPVMFVISGSAEPQWNIKDFVKESGMNQYADNEDHKFIAVYPFAKKHNLGVYSKEPAYGWNAVGSLLDKQDLLHAGYDDITFIKSIANLMPKLASVDSSHNDWGAVAFSQGGLFLNSLVSRVPHLFPSVGLVGTSMQKHFPYEIKPGNAENVAIVNLLGDKTTLPIYGNLTYQGEKVLAQLLRHTGHKDIVERMDPLAAINNMNQDPKLMEKFYKKNLFPGKHNERDTELSTPAAADDKDRKREYSKPDESKKLTVFSLAIAKHSYPGPLRDARTNATEKYTEFDASGEFARLFNEFNDKVHSLRSGKH